MVWDHAVSTVLPRICRISGELFRPLISGPPYMTALRSRPPLPFRHGGLIVLRQDPGLYLFRHTAKYGLFDTLVQWIIPVAVVLGQTGPA